MWIENKNYYNQKSIKQEASKSDVNKIEENSLRMQEIQNEEKFDKYKEKLLALWKELDTKTKEQNKSSVLFENSYSEWIEKAIKIIESMTEKWKDAEWFFYLVQDWSLDPRDKWRMNDFLGFLENKEEIFYWENNEQAEKDARAQVEDAKKWFKSKAKKKKED